MTDFKEKIGAKEAVLDDKVVVLPLLSALFFNTSKNTHHFSLKKKIISIPSLIISILTYDT